MAQRSLGPATWQAVQALAGTLVHADRQLLVACSGGADSLALAVTAAHCARRHGRTSSALIIDHGLQPGSASVAERARDQVNTLGLSAEIIAVSVATDSGRGTEAAARDARMSALASAAEKGGATVLLGHTRDDQAETVLLGLARGSGSRSLAGMAIRSGPLLRPFLSLPRSVTQQVCVEADLTPWQDPHNSDPAFARARVRQRVLPVLEGELGPGVTEALCRTAELCRDDADLLDELARAAYQENASMQAGNLVLLPSALRRRVILCWLTQRGVAGLSMHHIRQVERLVTHWHGQRHVDLPGATVRRLEGSLTVTSTDPRPL